LLQLEHLSKSFGEKTIVHDVQFSLKESQIAAIHGASGTGKTTLLHMIAGIIEPDEGTVVVCGQNIHLLKEQERRIFLAEHVGLVFQSFHVLPYLTVLENILLPSLFYKNPRQDVEKRILRLLDRVDMASMIHTKVAELSGGQRQRVAVVRALAHSPKLILADEPTGNLDEKVGLEVMDLLHTMAKEEGVGVLLVTHEGEYLKNIPLIWELDKGSLQLRK